MFHSSKQGGSEDSIGIIEFGGDDKGPFLFRNLNVILNKFQKFSIDFLNEAFPAGEASADDHRLHGGDEENIGGEGGDVARGAGPDGVVLVLREFVRVAADHLGEVADGAAALVRVPRRSCRAWRRRRAATGPPGAGE